MCLKFPFLTRCFSYGSSLGGVSWLPAGRREKAGMLLICLTWPAPCPTLLPPPHTSLASSVGVTLCPHCYCYTPTPSNTTSLPSKPIPLQQLNLQPSSQPHVTTITTPVTAPLQQAFSPDRSHTSMTTTTLDWATTVNQNNLTQTLLLKTTPLPQLHSPPLLHNYHFNNHFPRNHQPCNNPLPLHHHHNSPLSLIHHRYSIIAPWWGGLYVCDGEDVKRY